MMPRDTSVCPDMLPNKPINGLSFINVIFSEMSFGSDSVPNDANSVPDVILS